MHARAAFKEATKASFFLHLDEPESLEIYLHDQLWLGKDEVLRSVEKPGEGNMNQVVRVMLMMMIAAVPPG